MLRKNFGCRSRATGLIALAVATSGIAHAQQPPPVPGRAGQVAPGQQFDLAFSLGGAWSDNINRQPEIEDEGTIGQAGVQLGYSQQSRRLTTDINANVMYEHFFDGVFDNDVIGGADGLFILGIVPERFEWFLQETFGQINSDPFSASTPDNRESVNYFTTGPDFTLGLGGATSMRLSGRYSSTQYEVTELDGERYSATGALIYQLSGNSNLSLNVTGEEIKFDDQNTNVDYEQQQAFMRYEAQGARTGLSLDLGYTSLEGDTTDADGLLVNLALSRRLSTASVLTFSAGTQFSDSGDLFRATQGGQGPTRETQSVIGSSDPFENRFAALSWDFDRNRTGFGFGAIHSEERYENFTELDRTVTTFSGNFSRELSQALDVRLFALLEREEFDSTGFQDDEVRGGASIGWNVARTLQLRFQVERYDRDSTAEATEYTENRASLFLVWSPVTSP
jgi:hypothetical protein